MTFLRHIKSDIFKTHKFIFNVFLSYLFPMSYALIFPVPYPLSLYLYITIPIASLSSS